MFLSQCKTVRPLADFFKYVTLNEMFPGDALQTPRVMARLLAQCDERILERDNVEKLIDRRIREVKDIRIALHYEAVERFPWAYLDQ